MNFIAQCIHLQSNSYRSLGAILRFFKNSQHHFKIKRQGCISKTKIACLHQQAQKKGFKPDPFLQKSPADPKRIQRPQGGSIQNNQIGLYTRHEHRQTPTIFFIKLQTFALLFFYLDMEYLGLFGVFVDFLEVMSFENNSHKLEADS